MASDRDPLQFSDSTGHHDSERTDSGLLQENGVDGKPPPAAPLNIAAIKKPPNEPSDIADEFTTQQLLDLTPSQRVAYQHIQATDRYEEHIRIIRLERDGHKDDYKGALAKIDELKDSLHQEKVT